MDRSVRVVAGRSEHRRLCPSLVKKHSTPAGAGLGSAYLNYRQGVWDFKKSIEQLSEEVGRLSRLASLRDS